MCAPFLQFECKLFHLAERKTGSRAGHSTHNLFEISRLNKTQGLPAWHLECFTLAGVKASFPSHEMARHVSGASTPQALMVNLNESEAQTFQQILNGERLWSWPNGRIQLGQSFPDVTIINHLVRNGLLDQNYQPTEHGRSALQSWLKARGPASLPTLLPSPAR
jgi:hypothetical protein